MFGRLRWLGTGLAIGAGATVWAQRKARALGDRYRPAQMMNDAVDRVSGWPAEVRAAVSDGRRAMRQKEDELRQREDLRQSSGPASTPQRETKDPTRHRNGYRPGSERPRH